MYMQLLDSLKLHMIGWGDSRPWAFGQRCRCRPSSSRSPSPLCLLSNPLVELLSWIIVSRINPVSSHGEHAQWYCEELWKVWRGFSDPSLVVAQKGKREDAGNFEKLRMAIVC